MPERADRPAHRHRHATHRRRCAGRWPRPRSATTCSATTRPSTRSRSGPPSCSARRPGCSSPAARWATSSPRWPTCARGQETIAGASSHIVLDEAAGHAVVVGASVRALEDRPDGTLDLDDDRRRRSATRPTSHEPITGLIALENTHAHSMGQPLPPGLRARGRRRSPDERGVPLHIDGARFCNAVVAQRDDGVTATRPRRPGRLGHVLPVQGPRLPGRLGRRRVERRSSARAPRAQAGRRRDAPGRRSSRRPGWWRCGRPGRHDRPPRRRPRQRPPAGRGARRDATASGAPAASPSRTHGPPRPGRASRPTSCCSGSTATGRRSSPRSRARNVLMVDVSARTGPGRHPPRTSRPPTSTRSSARRARPSPRRRRRPAVEPIGATA